MAGLEYIEAIEKRLWSAADTLRVNSNYASNEYFLPVSNARLHIGCDLLLSKLMNRAVAV